MMSSSNSVTVMCPNKHRVVLKIPPSKILHQILEEACKRQGFSAEGYGLASHGKPLDLSLTFRLSGLPNNCNLEIIPQQNISSDQKVQIAVQLPDGERPLLSLRGDSTLLEVLQETEEISENKGKLLTPEGANAYPVINYMNQQFEGVLVLATTTLKSIGICGGRTLLRYSVKEIDPEKLEEINANVEKAQEQERRLEKDFERKKLENLERERLEEERKQHWEAVRLQEEKQEKKMMEQVSASQFPEETKGKNLIGHEQNKSRTRGPGKTCERRLMVYRDEADEHEAETSEKIPDEFFDITPEDVMKMQKLLKEER